MLCIETNSINQELLEFLKILKNKRLKTKVIAIIPNKKNIKHILLSYGCDDYLCKPYNQEDLLLRCKNLIKCLPIQYEIVYQNNYLRYERKLNRIMYKNTYIPLTPTEIFIVKLLIKRSIVTKEDIKKYLESKENKAYSHGYITVLIYRIRGKIRLCTGRNLIRNKYGRGYSVV